MFPLHVPLIADNTVLLGEVSESLYLGVFSDLWLAPNVYAYTFEHVAGTNYNINEVVVTSTGVVTGGFHPFGSVAAAITSQDSVIIACDSPIDRFYFDIDQAGVHPGTLEIHDSADGLTFGRLRVIGSDGSNGFRNTGIREIVLGSAGDPVAWSPGGDILGLPARRYYRLRLNGVNAGGATAAPRIARVWLRHGDGAVTYSDFTANVNGDLTTTPAGGTLFPTVGESVYFATANLAIGEERYLTTQQANVRTRVQEFLAANGWAAGTIVDPSNDFTVVPTNPPEHFSVTWTAPAGYSLQPPPFTLPAGAAAITTAFWRRIRTTAVATMGPLASPLFRARARQYGTANTTGGMRFSTAQNVRAASILLRGPISGTGARALDVVNLSDTAGTARRVTIPGNSVRGATILTDFEDFSLPAGDRLGIVPVGGGIALQDVLVNVEI